MSQEASACSRLRARCRRLRAATRLIPSTLAISAGSSSSHALSSRTSRSSSESASSAAITGPPDVGRVEAATAAGRSCRSRAASRSRRRSPRRRFASVPPRDAVQPQARVSSPAGSLTSAARPRGRCRPRRRPHRRGHSSAARHRPRPFGGIPRTDGKIGSLLRPRRAVQMSGGPSYPFMSACALRVAGRRSPDRLRSRRD